MDLKDAVRRHLQGEEAAFPVIYAALLPMIRRMTRRCPRPQEDLHQEIWLRLLRALPRYVPDPQRPFTAWASGVIRHGILNHWRRLHGHPGRKRRPGEVLPFFLTNGPEEGGALQRQLTREPSPLQTVLAQELRQRALQHIACLGAKSRPVAERLLEGWTCREIRAELGGAYGTTKGRIEFVRKTLRPALDHAAQGRGQVLRAGGLGQAAGH